MSRPWLPSHTTHFSPVVSILYKKKGYSVVLIQCSNPMKIEVVRYDKETTSHMVRINLS